MKKTHLILRDENIDAPNPEETLLRQVITLGTLIKILLGVGALLMGIGGYEVVQLDRLRDQAGDLKVAIVSLQSKVETSQVKMDGIQSQANKSEDTMKDIKRGLEEVQEKMRQREPR